jgi:hypothetical protein
MSFNEIFGLERLSEERSDICGFLNLIRWSKKSNMGRSKRSNIFSLFKMPVYRVAVSLELIRETILNSWIETFAELGMPKGRDIF